MRKRLALFLTPVLLLAMLPGAVSAAPADPDRARHEAAMQFWTAERLASAVSRDITFDPVRGFQPAARPTKPPSGGGGDTSGLVLGVPWTQGGDVYKGVGKVFFAMGAFYYQCSGTVIKDGRSGESLVLTAGHCVIDKGKFATNWIFIPAYQTNTDVKYNGCAAAPDRCWSAKALVVNQAFASQNRFNNTAVLNDFAFAVLGQGTNTKLLETATGGAFGIDYTATKGQVLSAFGYPAGAPYDGKVLDYCQGPIGTDPNMADKTWSMACKMTGGSSGGSWIDGDPKVFSSIVRSLNSYGYSGVDNMYGPKFNTSTQAVFNVANTTANANSIVP